MNQEIEYDERIKCLEWESQYYSFLLAVSIEQLLEIDNALQISVNQARMDLILSKQIIPVYVKKETDYKIMILLKNNDDVFLLDYFCGYQKTIPEQNELEIIKAWCDKKKIILFNGVRL